MPNKDKVLISVSAVNVLMGHNHPIFANKVKSCQQTSQGVQYAQVSGVIPCVTPLLLASNFFFLYLLCEKLPRVHPQSVCVCIPPCGQMTSFLHRGPLSLAETDSNSIRSTPSIYFKQPEWILKDQFLVIKLRAPHPHRAIRPSTFLSACLSFSSQAVARGDVSFLVSN